MSENETVPMNLDSDNYNIYLYGEITHMAGLYVQQCVSEAIIHGRHHPQNLIISSGGGSLLAGLDVIATIRQAQKHGIKVWARVNSVAASMAAYVMLACDHRSMSPIASLMLHGWEEGGGNHGVDKKTRAALDENIRYMEASIVALVRERSTLTEERIAEIFADSSHKYFTAEQALEAGLVDEVCW